MVVKLSRVFHADHGVSDATIQAALDAADLSEGFFLRTVELDDGHAPLVNALHGPACGDPPVRDSVRRVRDAADAWRQETPFVKRAPRATRLLTMIGMVKDGGAEIWTAYGGPAATRIPADPSLVPGSAEYAEAVAFWRDHALSEPL